LITTLAALPCCEGFITLAGITTRNGILKVSHYVNLCKFEGEAFERPMIVRGSLERFTPVLMTALVAAFALTPLLLAANAPGKEILHPVAVVIFGGLISSTLLDTLITPLVFAAVGRKPTERLLQRAGSEAFRTPENSPDPTRRRLCQVRRTHLSP
jgi:HME family heavy-metal exporter